MENEKLGEKIPLNAMVGRSRYAAEKNLKPLYTPKFAQFRANK